MWIIIYSKLQFADCNLWFFFHCWRKNFPKEMILHTTCTYKHNLSEKNNSFFKEYYIYFKLVVRNLKNQFLSFFGAIHKWRHPIFEIFDPSLLPRVTHLTKKIYEVTLPFGRSPSYLSGWRHLFGQPLYT